MSKKSKGKLTDKLEFVEEMAGLYEQFGAPPMAGRIVGWLMICEPELQTAAQLATALKASKGSISTMTRYLQQVQAVERVKKPGERAAYFRFARRPMSEVMERRIAMFAQVERLAAKGLGLLADATPERRAPLQQLHDFHRFMRGEISNVFARWERTQAQGNPR